MEAKEYGEAYLRNEKSIKKALMSKKIYDEDLLHDTYIALYEHSQEREIRDFVNTFVGVYMNMAKRREESESHYDCYDHTQMLNFDRADESDLAYREQVGRRVDWLLRKYIGHPQPGERNHKRACEILKLYLEGYRFRKIAKIVNLDVSVVYRYLKRAVKKIEEQQDLTTI